MNLLVIVDRTWPSDHAFIEEVYAKRLRSFGHRVTIVMSQHEGTETLVRRWNNSVVVAVASQSKKHSRLQLMCETVALVRNRGYDVVLVRNLPLSALAASYLGNAPVAYQISHFKEETVTYLTRVRNQSWYRGTLKRTAARLGVILRQWVLSVAKLVLPVSEPMADALGERGQKEEDVAVVGLGANRVDVDKSEVARVRASYCSDDRTALLLYVGTLTRARHLEVLIDALVELHDSTQAQLLFVGSDKTGDGDEYLEGYARHRGVDEFVEVVGPVPREKVPVFIAAADIGLSHFPDHWIFEMNSPIKVMEYLAQGLPVVCSEQPEQARLVWECNAGLVVDSGSPREYASAITRVLSESWNRERIAKNFVRRRSYDNIVKTVNHHLVNIGNVVENGKSGGK